MLRFYGLRILRDYLGHIILIGLPVALITIMTAINQQATGAEDASEIALFIGFIYILMFNGFGGAYTFEGLEHDFYKPFKQRLMASPVNPMRFVMANILFSVIISYLQSLVILFYVILMYGSIVPNLFMVMVVILLSVVLAQLFSAIAIFSLKKASKAQAVMTVYIIAAMIIAGFFFPLPQTTFTELMSKYSSPIAWAHYGIYGFMSKTYSEAFIGLGLLSGFAIIAGLITYKLSRSVTA